MGDQIEATMNQDGIQTVTSVGNSWIICRSKSHAGRIYYFNTLSGEAAWNLSDQEMEKAKKRTKLLESQSGGEFESCPEPKDPPIESNRTSRSPQTSQIFIPSRVYNKQIINNQFAKQTLPSVVSTQCANCSSVSAIDAADVNMPAAHSCNPNVWTIPPLHQIVIAPTPSSILNQLQTPLNIPYNNKKQRVSVQNTTLSLSHRFDQMQSVNAPERNLQFSNKFSKRINNNRFTQQHNGSPNFENYNRCPDSIDLRQKLTARRKSGSWNNLRMKPNCQTEESKIIGNKKQTIQIIKPTVQFNDTAGSTDDQWLKDNADFHGSQIFLNVTPLKQLVTAGSNSIWYIVADNSVLLNHIKLINVIVNSDEMCQLMVPDFIMADLQTKSGALNDVQMLGKTHHTLQILSQQFTAGHAVIGKDPSSDNNVHDFCCRLSLQDHNVVLISNNIQWKSYAVNSILLLNVQEVKDMLAKVAKPEKRFTDECNIQITIPNSVIDDGEIISDSKYVSIGSQFNDTNDLSETQFNTGSNLHIPRKVDVGIQTDLYFPKDFYPKKVNSLGVNTEINIVGDLSLKSNEHLTYGDVDDTDDMPKKREIRLKRNLSRQPATDNNIEKKQFKWRRKRDALHPNAKDADQITESHTTGTFHSVEEISKANEPSPKSNRLDNAVMLESKSSCYEPVDSSETSSSCFVHKRSEDKLIIEETSTSGIISNSTDSECSQGVKHAQINKTRNEEADVCKCVMFEVENPVMEEYLRMRSDEWVSRFVQIMEEALTQILQQAPVFLHRSLPPPWNIHEAAECIKMKFENDPDVKDAAHRLSNVLYTVSDDRGKICVYLQPSQFMKMYSFGVYLIDALQSILSNCEDLQTAADSLAKLLNDIQDPPLDTSHTDALMDSSHHPPADITETDTSNINDIDHLDGTTENAPIPEETPLKDPKRLQNSSATTVGRKYNLRSTQKKTIEEEPSTEQPVTFIRKIDIESNFFLSLRLKKNQNCAEVINEIATNRDSCLDSLETSEQNVIPVTLDNRETPNNADVQNVKSSNEPNIVRNFSKCLEFEEKIKTKQKEIMDVDTDDYSQEDEDGYDYYDDYSYSGFEYYENEEEMTHYGDNKDSESSAIEKTAIFNNGNGGFEVLKQRIINEVQNTFLEVHSFCAKIKDELSHSKTLSSPRKLEIKEKAEGVRLVMNTLNKTLNGIIDREDGNCEEKMENILKEAGIRLDSNKSIEYREMIAQYPKQANILLDAVNIVIDAVK